MLKDIDQLLENNNLNSDYIKDNNALEINLNSTILSLTNRIHGCFEIRNGG